MELVIPDKNFICIDYPGDVDNIDKAIDTLGGLKVLHKTFKDRNVRIKLNFRNEDNYSKPAYGNSVSRACLILKVRRKKNAAEQDAPGNIQAEIIGTSGTSYNFTSMCDFQYLAMKRLDGGSYESHLEESLIRQVQSREWLSKPAHLFILPPIFSRFDQPVQYCFRENAKKYKNVQFPDNCIGMSRSRRPHFTIVFKFNSPTVPCQPQEGCAKKLQRMAIPSWKIDAIAEKFKQQKIWSSMALFAEVGPSITRDDLKNILPSVAFYCADGPWRAMWVKLGYDMRQDPSSKIYQNLDTRQEKRISSLYKSKIPAKRSTFNYHLPNTFTRNAGHQAASVQQPSSLKQPDNEETDFKKSLASSYIFCPGVMPKHRQIFYHLYNINEPEVQKLVHMNDGNETECTEKDGWCLPETIEKCRAIINSYRYKNAEEMGLQTSEEVYDETIDDDDDVDEDDEDNDKNCTEDEDSMNEYDDDCEEEEGEEDDGDMDDIHDTTYNVMDQNNFDKILELLPQEDND